jgi:hypothetical protein
VSFTPCSHEAIEDIVVVSCVSQVLAHTAEIQRSSKCRLADVWLKRRDWQALETVPRQAVVSIYLGHKEVRYGDNNCPSRS